MIFNHPCIRNIRIADSRGTAARTLILETDLDLPRAGRTCEDSRLIGLLEYLEIAKARAPAFFSRFETVEIRGANDDIRPHEDAEPVPMPPARAVSRFSPMEALR